MCKHKFNFIFEFLLSVQFLLLFFILKNKTPILMALQIIGLSIFFGLNYFMLFSKWVGLSVILLFSGGIIIVFLYVAALSSNIKFNKFSTFWQINIYRLLVLVFLLLAPKFNKITSRSLATSLYKADSGVIFFLLIMYLLITLFLATKITENFKGAIVEKL